MGKNVWLIMAIAICVACPAASGYLKSTGLTEPWIHYSLGWLAVFPLALALVCRLRSFRRFGYTSILMACVAYGMANLIVKGQEYEKSPTEWADKMLRQLLRLRELTPIYVEAAIDAGILDEDTRQIFKKLKEE